MLHVLVSGAHLVRIQDTDEDNSITTPGMARVPREGIATPVGSRTPCCKIVHFMAAIESGWPPAFICIIISGTYSTFRGTLVRPYVGILFLSSTELTDDEKT